MATYKGYRIVPSSIWYEHGYEVQTEHHDNGRVTWRRTAGGYRTINEAKAAINARFGRL